MPRATTKRSTARSKAKAVEVAVTEVPHAGLVVPEVGPIFPLVKDSFRGVLPGDVGYSADRDRLLIGFQYGNSSVPQWLPSGTKIEEIDTYDFLTYPSGKRKGQAIPPHGCGFTDLEYGPTKYSALPPIHIWKEGRWLADVIFDSQFDVKVLPQWIQKKVDDVQWPADGSTPDDLYHYYVTSGEGTTGNNLYRVFELPTEACTRVDPQHPINWSKTLLDQLEEEQLKKHPHWSSEGAGYGHSYPTAARTVVPPSTPVTKAPPIPAGVRYRCVGCGHWYGQSDLPGHNQVCGKGEESDWAMMCHKDCGCTTLDQACSPKPGFPRPKAVEPEKEKEEEPSASTT